MVKRLPTMRETQIQFLGQEDLLEKEMATHSSILAWKIPWMEEPGGLQSMGSQRVGHDEHLHFLGLIPPFRSTLGPSDGHCHFVPRQHNTCSCPRKEERMKIEVRRPSHHRRLPLKYSLKTGRKVSLWTQVGWLGTPAQAGLKEVCNRTESLCYTPETNMT